MRVRMTMALAAVAALVNPGCSPGGPDEGTASDVTVVAAGEDLSAGIPAPRGPVVLRVTGATATPNDGDTVAFDLATLERLRQEAWTLYEPFVEAELTFTGVPLPSLLDVIGTGGADTAVFDALDDYRVTLTLTQLRAGDVLLATRLDGAPIAVEDGGPIRLVFADGSETGSNPDLWIWSIRDLMLE